MKGRWQHWAPALNVGRPERWRAALGAGLGILLTGFTSHALGAPALIAPMGASAVLLFALLSWLAVHLLKRAVPEARAPRWLVLATRQIAARPAFAVLQVSALAVGLLALVLLVLLRTDLVSSWRRTTPRWRRCRATHSGRPISTMSTRAVRANSSRGMACSGCYLTPLHPAIGGCPAASGGAGAA